VKPGDSRLASVVAALVLVSILGFAAALLVERGSWLYENGAAVWVAFLGLVALLVGRTLAVVLNPSASTVTWMSWGAVLFTLLTVALVASLFLPYAVGIGNREPHDFSQDNETSWKLVLAILFATSALIGPVLGALVGLAGRHFQVSRIL
jgi:hypothetical protein